MSNLLVRLLLAILLIPLAGLLYVVVYFLLSDTKSDQISMIAAGFGVWAFVAIYWIVLWHGAIRWNRRRVIAIVVVAILATILSGLVAVAINSRSRYYSSPFGYFVGSVMPRFCGWSERYWSGGRKLMNGSSGCAQRDSNRWSARPAATISPACVKSAAPNAECK